MNITSASRLLDSQFILALIVSGCILCLPNTNFAQVQNQQPQQSGIGLPNSPQQDDAETAAAKAAALQNARQTLLQQIDKLSPGSVSPDSEMEKKLQEAIDLFLNNKPDETRQLLGEARTQFPTLPPPNLLMSVMYFAAGNNAAGIQSLEQCAADDPQYPSTYSGFARIAVNQNRFTDALALCLMAIQKIEQGSWSEEQVSFFRVEALDSMADVAISRKQWEPALAHLSELRQLLPENGKVTLKMAQVYFELDRIDESLRSLVITETLSNELRKPEVIIADWYLINKDNEKSREWIGRAIDKYPTEGGVHLALAQWQLRNNKLPEAAENAHKASTLGADEYNSTYLKGQIAFNRRQYDNAETHFSKLNQIRPGDVQASNFLVLSLIESDQPEKRQRALELASMNQRLYPRESGILASLGWVYFKSGNIKQAEEIFQNLINVQPMTPATGYFIANVMSKNGATDSAIQFLKLTLETDAFFIYRNRAQQMYDTLVAGGEQPSQDGAAQDGEPTPADGNDGQ